MKFSYDIPNKPGYYWARLNGHDLMPVEVEIHNLVRGYDISSKYILLIGYDDKIFDLFNEGIEIGDEIVFKD